MRRKALKGAVLVFITSGVPSEEGGCMGGPARASHQPACLPAACLLFALVCSSQSPPHSTMLCVAGSVTLRPSRRCPPFLPPLLAGKRFIYEKAKELGVRAVIVDGPDSWSQVGWPTAGGEEAGTQGRAGQGKESTQPGEQRPGGRAGRRRQAGWQNAGVTIKAFVPVSDMPVQPPQSPGASRTRAGPPCPTSPHPTLPHPTLPCLDLLCRPW